MIDMCKDSEEPLVNGLHLREERGWEWLADRRGTKLFVGDHTFHIGHQEIYVLRGWNLRKTNANWG
jgi:hypothetical protein